ncbi:hypothetical protein [Klenkia terrae]|uniref:Uncharacterized protein n=1 Tax=Klenkia terrae TaxID=1052259 RepID=A0ABU8E2J2_9ACTN|nr:hypothetical protein [Klenkia terrae]SSC21617.1 Hypothetical protein KLENKIAIHU_186 [Klenkia terrae]
MTETARHAIKPNTTYDPQKATESVDCICGDRVPSAQIEQHVRDGNGE